MILYLLRKEIKLIAITFISITILGLCNYQYSNLEILKDYEKCQNKNLNDNQIKSCIEKFSQNREDFMNYLTTRNIDLAKNNEKYKILIEQEIINQNNDKTCKLTKELDWAYKKDGSPCSA